MLSDFSLAVDFDKHDDVYVEDDKSLRISNTDGNVNFIQPMVSIDEYVHFLCMVNIYMYTHL